MQRGGGEGERVVAVGNLMWQHKEVCVLDLSGKMNTCSLALFALARLWDKFCATICFGHSFVQPYVLGYV